MGFRYMKLLRFVFACWDAVSSSQVSTRTIQGEERERKLLAIITIKQGKV